MTLVRTRPVVLAALVALMLAAPALAGPPLLCFPFDIGAAGSLPIGSGGWEAIDAKYDTSRLIDDTVALLAPTTPIVVRMETLRRATLYAAKNPALASALLERLQQRASSPVATAPHAVFDFGYLVETYKQATHLFGRPMPAAHAINGYALVEKASAMTEDPGIDFALAVMTRDRSRGVDVYRGHLAKVVKAAPGNKMIAANIARQFGDDLGVP